MPVCRCECGAKYRVPDSVIGKRSKCKHCGTIFTLEPEDEGPIPIADDNAPADEVSGAIDRGRLGVVAEQGRLIVAPGSPAAAASGETGRLPVTPVRAPHGYWTDVLWSFLFLTTPANLIYFLVIWFLMILAPIARLVSVIGIVVWIGVFGWYTAFRFLVIESAAAGDEQLPKLTVSRDILDDFVSPCLAWMASWFVVLIPAGAYIAVAWERGRMTGEEAAMTFIGGLDGLWQGTTSGEPVFDVLLCLGIALWPMMILCFALGGVATVYRIDLMFVTIFRTLPAYLATLALLFGVVFLTYTLQEHTAGQIASRTGTSMSGTLGGAFAFRIVAVGLDIYLNIVMMRLIGLYYHHFKGSFAWDWG